MVWDSGLKNLLGLFEAKAFISQFGNSYAMIPPSTSAGFASPQQRGGKMSPAKGIMRAMVIG